MRRETQSTYDRWYSVSGPELEEAYTGSEPFSSVVIPCQAVYFWRPSFRPPEALRNDAAACAAWIDRICSFPFANVGEKKICHFLTLSGIQLQPAQMSQEKRSILKKVCQKKSGRRWVLAYLRKLTELCPAIYCGETGNLPSRVRDHLSAASSFGAKVTGSARISWEDLDLHYYAIGEVSEEDSKGAVARRQLLETMGTALTLSGYVDRRG